MIRRYSEEESIEPKDEVSPQRGLDDFERMSIDELAIAFHQHYQQQDSEILNVVVHRILDHCARENMHWSKVLFGYEKLHCNLFDEEHSPWFMFSATAKKIAPIKYDTHWFQTSARMFNEHLDKRTTDIIKSSSRLPQKRY